MDKINWRGIRTLPAWEVDQLLSQVGLVRGDWNEITRIDSTQEIGASLSPLRDGLHLYAVSRNLASYLPKQGWIVFQFDNSTFVAQDVRELVEDLLLGGDSWGESVEALFVDGEGRERESGVAALINWILLFEMHAWIATERWQHRLRLAVVDGQVCFRGDAKFVRETEEWLNRINDNPLGLVDERFMH